MNEFLKRILKNHHEYLSELNNDIPRKIRYLKHRLIQLKLYEDYIADKTDTDIEELELFDYKYLATYDDIVFLLDSPLFPSTTVVGIEERRKEVGSLIKEVEQFLEENN